MTGITFAAIVAGVVVGYRLYKGWKANAILPLDLMIATIVVVYLIVTVTH